MKGIGLFVVMIMMAVGCSKKEEVLVLTPGCSLVATVKDLRPMDGCDFVFQLADGTQLIPERRTYIQAPKQDEDPLYYFQMKDGEKVKISYHETQLLGTCMAGKIVFVTCITLAGTGE